MPPRRARRSPGEPRAAVPRVIAGRRPPPRRTRRSMRAPTRSSGLSWQGSSCSEHRFSPVGAPWVGSPRPWWLAGAQRRSTVGSGSCPPRRRCTARPCAGSGALGLSLAVAQGQPGAFGQQVGTPVCGLGQFGDRHGFRRTANAPDGGMLRRRPSDPTAKETIRVRAVHMCKIERLFESRQDTLSGGLP